MPRRSFQYKFYPDPSTGEEISQAIIPISVRIGAISIPLNFLIDSGGQKTFIRSDTAKSFNLDLNTYPEIDISGFGDTKGRLVSNCSIGIARMRKNKFPANLVFVENLEVDGILGQREFFGHFKIEFDKASGYVYVEDLPSRPVEPPDEDFEDR